MSDKAQIREKAIDKAQLKLSMRGYKVRPVAGADGHPETFEIHWIVNDDPDNWQEELVGLFSSPITALELLELHKWPRSNKELLRGMAKAGAFRRGSS